MLVKFFFFQQKTAYEVRMSVWSSNVCSSDLGEPNGYIVGREAGGAFAIGLRYGSGTLFHKVEGERPVYWTGPSVGFDIGADASKTFALVYHLYVTESLFERFPPIEGKLYFVGDRKSTRLNYSH